MGGQLTGTSEIVGVARDPQSEMPGPDTVDHDPGGKGVFLTHHPLGKGQPPLSPACWERTRFHASEGFRGAQPTRLHGIALGVDAASVVDNVRVEVALAPGILRHLQAALNVFH